MNLGAALTFLRFGLWSAAGGLVGALLQAALSGPALLAILRALLIATGLASITANFGGSRPPPKSAGVAAVGVWLLARAL